MKGDNLEIRIL